MSDRTCTLPDCTTDVHSRGLCSFHYYRWLRASGPERGRVPKGVEVPQGSCYCKACKSVKTYAEFPKEFETRRSRVATCRACQPPRRLKRNKPEHVVVPPGHKWCGNCGQVKPFADYDKRTTYCKPCRLEMNRRYLYGITPEEVELLLHVQGGVCAICKRPCKRDQKQLCVDHCHETGRIRGLLCSRCNSAIGYFEDDPARLTNAIAYLQRVSLF